MSASGDPLWERLQLDYFRRLSPFRRTKRWLSIGAAILASAWVAQAEVRNDHAIYSSGSLSVSHAPFAADCRKCHLEHWTRFKYVRDDNRKRLAFNNACLECHGKTLGNSLTSQRSGEDRDAQPGASWHVWPRSRQGAEMESDLACSHCHVEHQGEGRLSTMTDEKCVTCHAELTAFSMAPERGREPIAPHVSAFSNEQHPRFRSIRTDPGNIKFTHAEHLMNKRYVKEGYEQLRCDDCHRAGKSVSDWRFGEREEHELSRRALVPGEPALQDAYMGPIRYSLHCKACHRLVVAKEDRDKIGGELGVGRVPHTTPREIRSYLRRALTDYFRGSDPRRVMEAKRETRGDPDPLDMMADEEPAPASQPAPIPKPADPEAAITESLRRIETALYGTQREADRSPDDPSRFETARCALCHVIKPDGDLFSIEASNVPSRWFRHSSFDHGRHKTELLESDSTVIPGQTNACTGCHKITESSGTRIQWKADNRLPSEVLIPDVETCTECHGPSKTSAIGFDGGVGHNCVVCHTFHVPPEAGTMQSASSP